jgi:transaldolase/glucose-6-phosphate isomerase
VPAVLAGTDVEAILDGAEVAAQNCESPRAESNLGLWLGGALGELALGGRDKLTLMISEPIASFGLWAEQLVAESTGKRGRGILPVADEPAAIPARKAPIGFSCTLRNASAPDAGHDRFVAALAEHGQPRSDD